MNDTRSRILGAVVGGAIGVAAHWGSVHAGYHMAGVAGIGLALGVSAGARSRSLAWGVVTAGLAVALSLVTDWWLRPFLADGSLSYFLAHLGDLSPLSKASLLAAGLLGYYFGRGRRPAAPKEAP